MKVLAHNRRGRYDYEIQDKLVAGLVLTGPEVKSAKQGQVSLQGSYISQREGELYLVGAHFTPYQHAAGDQDPTRARKLLMHRQQIDTLLGDASGMKAVPLTLVLEKGLVKLEIGVGRARKKIDKREVIKKRDQELEARRAARAWRRSHSQK